MPLFAFGVGPKVTLFFFSMWPDMEDNDEDGEDDLEEELVAEEEEEEKQAAEKEVRADTDATDELVSALEAAAL